MIAEKLGRMGISDMRWAARGKKVFAFFHFPPQEARQWQTPKLRRFVHKGNTGTRKRKRARRMFGGINIRVGEA